MAQGLGVPMLTLLKQIEYDPAYVAGTRAVLLDMGAQVWWRLAAFREWPFHFTEVCDGRTSEAQRLVLNELFAKSETVCCLDKDFARKVLNMFNSAEHTLVDSALAACLRGRAEKYIVVNMHLERLLSQVRLAIGSEKSPEAERVCGAGFLAQVLRDHLALGGRDPRIQDRRGLLQDGPPCQLHHG